MNEDCLQTATDIAIVFLDREFRIQRFTRSATTLFNFTSADLGRPLFELSHRLHDPEIVADAEHSLTHRQPAKRELRAGERWYLAHSLPYLTADDDIAGVVLTFLDITKQKRAEEELMRRAAESERQRRVYETVLTNTPDFVYVFSLDHKVLYANDALIKMWGRGSHGAIGKTFLEIGYEPWHAEMHDREIDQVRATRQPIRGEVPFNGTNGRRIYDYIFVPVIGPDGEVEAVAGTTRDVTERKATEERLRASEERQAFLVSLSDTLRPLSDPIAVQSEASRLLGEHLKANRVVYFEIHGDEYVIERDYTEGVRALAGRYPVSAFGPALLAVLLSGRTVIEADATTEPGRPAGEQAAFAAIQVRGHVDVPLVKEGKFVAGMTVHVSHPRDWTPAEVTLIQETAERTWASVERVRAEAALRQSEERSAFVRRSSGVGFWYCDLPFDVLQWDDLVKAHFHLPPDAAVTIDTFYDRIHPDDREPTRQAIEQSISGRTPYDTYYRTVNPDNLSIKWVRAIGRTFYAADGTPTRFDGVTLDVTDYKNAQAALLETDRRKDEFLANLSHEMRTPLGAIIGWISILRQEGCTAEDLQEGLAAIDRNSNAQVQLIEDVLDVSRIINGKLRLEMKPCEMVDVIRAGVDTVRPAAQARDITLETHLDPAASKISCDEVRMQQVLWNLVSNAVKFTPKGGTISVTLERERSNIKIQVKDNGQGMGPDLLPYIFERFRQADSSSRRKFGGLGLGLSIVKHIVEAHGGTVRAESEGEGKGSTFIVLLPIRAVRVEEDSTAPAAICRGASTELMKTEILDAPWLVRLDGIRVLLVDDEADARRLVVKVLEHAGAHVWAASSAREALDILSKQTPQILISDLGMPEEDGLDLIRQVRGSGVHPRDLPAIALTAFVSKDDERSALSAGFQVHLSKPVDPHDLTLVIARLTGRSH